MSSLDRPSDGCSPSIHSDRARADALKVLPMFFNPACAPLALSYIGFGFASNAIPRREKATNAPVLAQPCTSGANSV
jgi:hypothetical protein